MSFPFAFKHYISLLLQMLKGPVRNTKYAFNNLIFIFI